MLEKNRKALYKHFMYQIVCISQVMQLKDKVKMNQFKVLNDINYGFEVCTITSRFYTEN
jgi:hypothetical protein